MEINKRNKQNINTITTFNNNKNQGTYGDMKLKSNVKSDHKEESVEKKQKKKRKNSERDNSSINTEEKINVNENNLKVTFPEMNNLLLSSFGSSNISSISTDIQLIDSFQVSYASANVSLYSSKRTGLQAVLIQEDRPDVEGYFSVATEIDDDSGIPHSLEHLVFMGSKDYPYKGMLDTLANILYSTTNAWTATDSTVYTLHTAGWEGFESITPIYINHILYPTLTDSSCYTEVYHMDGDAEEKGVVFSEMQGTEDDSTSISLLELQRNLFPPYSGYSSETGGLTKNLRSLSPVSIRKFHSNVYNPQNLDIIVTGKVTFQQFEEMLHKIDSSLPDKKNDFIRPWIDSKLSPIPPLNRSIVRKVHFPDEDLSSGELTIGLLGPDFTDLETNYAIEILGKYLTSSSISLLNQKFVEIDDPFADSIDFDYDHYLKGVINLSFTAVPANKLKKLEKLLFEILEEHVKKSQFDLGRMKHLIERDIQKTVYNAELSVAPLYDTAINNFLYGDQNGDYLKKSLSDLSWKQSLLKWKKNDWEKLLNKWLIKNYHVSVLAYPSASEAERLQKESENVEKRRKELGPEKLKELKEKLDEAMDENNKKIPSEILDKFTSPDPEKISFIKTQTATAGRAKSILAKSFPMQTYFTGNKIQDLIDRDTPYFFPLFLHYEHTNSKFISISLFVSASSVSQNDLPYLDLLINMFFDTPVKLENGNILPYEDVVRLIKHDTVSNSIFQGVSGAFQQMLTIKLEVVPEKYAAAIDLIMKLTCKSHCSKERIKVTVEKLLAGIPESKRNGAYIAYSKLIRTLSSKDSAWNALNFANQEILLNQVKDEIKTDNYSVINHIKSLRDSLFTTGNIRILVSGNISNIENPVSAWSKYAKALPNTSLSKVPRGIDYLSHEGKSIGGKCFIVTTPATTSSYLYSVAKAPSNFLDPLLPALAVGIEYLDAVEGPFWRNVRGSGLAYGNSFTRMTDSGFLVFDLYRASDAPKAFSVCRKIVNEYLTDKAELDDVLFQGAKSSIVAQVAFTENNYFSAAFSSFINQVLKNVGANYKSNFLAKVDKVTKKEVLRALDKFIMPLYKHKQSDVFISCNPASSSETKLEFEKLGYKVEIENINDEL